MKLISVDSKNIELEILLYGDKVGSNKLTWKHCDCTLNAY